MVGKRFSKFDVFLFVKNETTAQKPENLKMPNRHGHFYRYETTAHLKLSLSFFLLPEQPPSYHLQVAYEIGGRLFILTNFLNLTIQREGEFSIAKRFWKAFKFLLVP